MTPSRSGEMNSFRVDHSVLSFTISCGVNIPEDSKINRYIRDVETTGNSSFEECLQSCAQYSTRQPVFTFGTLCSGLTWDKQGRCWLKTGVAGVMETQDGPNGAIAAILQWPPKQIRGEGINGFSSPNYSAASGLDTYNNSYWFSLCSNGTIFC